MFKICNISNNLGKVVLKNFSKIKFQYKYLSNNKIIKVEAEEGKSLLEVAHANDIDIEGACDSSLSCSTCHIILDDKIFKALPKPVEEEEDLLDLAFGLTPTSRLGCQIKVTTEFEGTTICIPSITKNLSDK
jgi:ferredoxin